MSKSSRRRKRNAGAKRKVVSLRNTNATSINLRTGIGSQVEVDREQGLIKNVAIITQGPATGHGFSVDQVMIDQVLSALGTKRMPIRFTHPELDMTQMFGRDSIECLVGHVENPKADGDVVRGDVRIGKYAEHSPYGNLREYLLGIAEEAPEQIGMSISFEPDEFEQSRGPDGEPLALGRVANLLAVDFVGDPGANRNGLLSKGPNTGLQKGNKPMDEQLLSDLRTLLGLADDSTEEDVLAVVRAKAIEAGDTGENTTETETEEPSTPPSSGPSASESMSSGVDANKVALDERNRAKTIRGLAAKLNLSKTWAERHVDDGTSLGKVRQDALDEVERMMKNNNVRGSDVSVGEDLNLSTLREGCRDAILLRAGVIKEADAHKRAPEFRRPMIELARRFLAAKGATDSETLSSTQILDRLGNRGFRKHYPTVSLAQSTSDFDNIAADAMGKSLRMAYEDAPAKWDQFCRRETAPDFKSIKPTALSESPDLVARDEGDGITYVTLSDSRETATLVEYVNGIKLTRQAMINDDLRAFGRIPQLQGMAAKRKEDDLAFGILTANAALADNVTLFHASAYPTGHANLISSGSGAPSVTTVAALEKLILKQKGPKSAARLGIEAGIIIVPAALKVVTQQFIGSAVDPAKSNSTPNPFANQLRVVWDSRLDDNSATAWYLAADPNRWDTIVMYFLDGEPTPVLRQETDFDTEDVKFAVRHTAIAKAIDFRGLAKTVGTA